MQLKEKVSWLMGTVQRTVFPHLEDCLDLPLTEQEKRLVTILERVHREKYVPKSASRQGLGRPIKERDALARSFVAKAGGGIRTPGLCCTRCVPPPPCGPSAALPTATMGLLKRRFHAPLPSVPRVVWRPSCMMPWCKSL